jgi:hypothetical protein
MCEWGQTARAWVPIPAHLSHTGQFRWDWKEIDSCLFDIVHALNEAGVYTAGCCCGHGKELGDIFLHDGRRLPVIPSLIKPVDNGHE